MKIIMVSIGFLAVASVIDFASAIEATPGEMAKADTWWGNLQNAIPAPFSFVYGGKPVSSVLNAWQTSRRAKDGAFEHIWTCLDTGLQVRLAGRQYADFPVIEWVVYLKNTGAADTPIIEDLQVLDMNTDLPAGDPLIHYAKGATCSIEDFRPMMRQLNVGGRLHVQPNGGRSSSDFLPFFNVELNPQSGVALGIGWSGEWAAEFTREAKDRPMRIRCGMAHTHFVLHPGEEVRTPRVALLFYEGGNRLRGQNLLRSFLLTHHRVKTAEGPLEPLTLNAYWGATKAEEHLRNIRAIIAHDLPIEYYWIDAEWFGQGRWHLATGDWTVKADVYPDGFKPLSDALHASGRKFLLWFEPERVCEGVPWYAEHQNWLLDVPKAQRRYNWGASQADPDWVRWESDRNQIGENDRLFNLGDPEARGFLTDFISSKITEFGLDCFRHDANIAPLEFWRAADASDRQGITEIRWIEGLYAFWDALLERHPNLIIDNCASGGRRIDLESISRSTPFHRTDFPNGSTAKQCHNYGISHWIPLNATTGVNPARDSAYDLRSTWSSSFVVGLFEPGEAPKSSDEPTDFPFDKGKAALAQYRDVRHFFLGDYYPLTEYSQAEDTWVAWQFHRADLKAGMVQVFRRPKSVCVAARLPLHGLDPDQAWSVENLDTGASQILSGKDLTESGLEVHLENRPDSAVFVYRRVLSAPLNG